jgi:hypothetical protein
LTAERPLVALLSAATAESLEDAIEDADLYGGFLNRVIPIAGAPKSPQPWPRPPDERMWNALVRDLDRLLARYATPVRLAIVDQDARKLWETFYEDFHQRQALAPELLAALTYRLHTHVQKLALFYAVLRGGKHIAVDDLTRALEIVAYVNIVIEDVLRPLLG